MEYLFNSYELIKNTGILSMQFLGNSLYMYLRALGVFAVFLIVFKIIQSVILYNLEKLAKRTSTEIDDTVIKVVRTIKPGLYFFVAFYFALQFLTLSPFIQKTINALLIIGIVYQSVHAVEIIIDYLGKKLVKQEKEESTKAALGMVNFLAKCVLWTFGVLLILSNLGFDITSLIAGLGVGGIAVALALQNILSDLFSSFAIYFDKPFTVGDYIVVGTHKGTVEKIGIKTTRIRSIQGEELVISNQELTSARISNYKKMKERRVGFSFGVEYSTSSTKLKAIPSIAKKIIESQKFTRFDRTHFKSFGDSALLFDVVYFVESGDYKKYMNIQQKVNIALKEEFEQQKISFAYPTRTVYLHGSSDNDE